MQQQMAASMQTQPIAPASRCGTLSNY